MFEDDVPEMYKGSLETPKVLNSEAFVKGDDIGEYRPFLLSAVQAYFDGLFRRRRLEKIPKSVTDLLVVIESNVPEPAARQISFTMRLYKRPEWVDPSLKHLEFR
ncbi:hypothetical protein A3K63_03140 [Candidatus Micrarchaeota archaeon RBG_16_49_10]|nr:MAG: hypothetical protein A3K63_03140 [Candidatus Micrarchaeota archaeon RBG_16_49_10]